MKESELLNASSFQHIPVLANEIIQSILEMPDELLNNGLIIDATVGGGGHSKLILKSHSKLRVVGLDQDPNAVSAARLSLKDFGSRATLISKNFADYAPTEKAIAILADLGVSSPQLDTPSRGFSFNLNGPIDMRMNPKVGFSAAKLLQDTKEKELADIIFKFGEEKRSRKIARKIKYDLERQGSYSGTTALAYAIAGCYPPKLRHGRIHPATKTFQALRIAVNNELNALESFLEKSPEWLIPGGLLMVISFHSLEDRRVKQAILQDERLEKITKKPIIETENNKNQNRRSRSAKLRIARRKLD